MKLRFLMALCLAVAPALGHSNEPSLQAVNSVPPSDFGVKKWMFEATPDPGKVFVLRARVCRNGTWGPDKLFVVNTSDHAPRAWVLLVDQSVLGGDARKGDYTWEIGTDSNDHWERRFFSGARLPNDQVSDGALALQVEWLKDGKKPETWEFSAQVESYEAMKAKIPSLPPLSTPFCWTNREELPPDPQAALK